LFRGGAQWRRRYFRQQEAVMKGRLAAVGLALAAVGCTEGGVPGAALESIRGADLHSRIATLASDSFAGRGPSSIGEERTMAYLQAEFSRLGLQAGNGESWYQDVPLVRSTVQGTPELTIRGRGAQARFAFADDYVAFTKRVAERAGLDNSELVFVGYGVVAPEFQWNDYEGLDVRGKTVVILVNDPGWAGPDTALFRGRAMTYYGRWTYKFEEAARQGAEGALIVHETEPAAYGWDVVRNSWTGPQFSLAAEDGNAGRVAVEGWIGLETARAIFRLAGQEFDSLKSQADRRGFQAVPLGVTASLGLRNEIVRSNSRNFLALLPGTDHADEYVIYMAHWDHFGMDPNREGDQIFNGAVDNATGTAGLIEIAEAFTTLSSPPSRSVLFLAVTAEEQGLLGSQYYGTHPVVPLAKTVAAINMDALNVNGRMRDVTVIGYGNSELDTYVEEAAQAQQRVVRPDPEPEKGYFYRSDHFSLAKVGVPAVYAESGKDNLEHGEAWTRERDDEYRAQRYHQPADEYDPAWDVTGMLDDLQLLFTVGYRLAHGRAFPNWREGTEFKAIRDQMLHQP
jgi:Zn-dependent M28 family amino/carboxypeptidase